MKRLCLKFFSLFVFLFCFVNGVRADSLWSDKSNLSYATYRPHKVGDVITIVIDETSLAQHSADINTSTNSQSGTTFDSTWGRLNKLLGKSNESQEKLGIAGSLKYQGKGKTQRASEVRSKISVSVTQIQPNGNFLVKGQKKVLVNDETEEIVVSGVVRPQDVTPENTVFSHQIADSQISIRGSGALGDKQSPGPLMRFLDWLF